MTTYIVTEGPSDVLLLQAALGISPGHANIQFKAAGGWSAADSLARSLLINGDNNVVLVVDADATDPNLVEERRRFLNRSLGEIREDNRWRVFVIAPSIEAILFEDESIVRALVDGHIRAEDFVRAEFEPKQVLVKLLSNRSLLAVFTERLPNIDMASLRSKGVIGELHEFVTRGLRPNNSSSRRVVALT